MIKRFRMPSTAGSSAWSFHPAIVAVVGIGSIAAELAIFVIVLLLVADQIIQCEAVMRSDEVQAARRALAGALVQIRASTDSACELIPSCLRRRSRSGAHRHGNGHSIPSSVAWKNSHLIGAARVPGLRDNLYVTQDGILGNAFEKRSVAQNVPMLISAQDGSEVEAKTINVHVHDPVTEHSRDELPARRDDLR